MTFVGPPAPIVPNPLPPVVGNPQYEQNMLNQMHNELTAVHAGNREVLDTIAEIRGETRAVWRQHVPGTWEIITGFFSNIFRAIGSLFTRNH